MASVPFILQPNYTLVSFSNPFYHARLLNGNLLEGQVPEQLYSVGVHGGAIEYVTLIF